MHPFLTRLPKNTSNEDLLILYALFKQATVGDCNTEASACSILKGGGAALGRSHRGSLQRPGMLDPKGRAKWDAWNAQKGKSKDQAMEEYIMKVGGLPCRGLQAWSGDTWFPAPAQVDQLKEKYGVA